MATAATLERLLATKEIVVVCGPGGVGKTTTAAALGAAAAASGSGRVLVLTVDPARRLADALALSDVSNEATRVDDEAFSALGIHPRGELWAAMLDTKASWDSLVHRHAPNARSADAILSNPLYRTITGRFAASHEYIAMERLYELHAEGRYDLVIVDTPPSLGALDFVDAPEKMAEFFSSRLLRWLTAPLRSRVLGLAARPFTEIGDRVLGTQFLADIGEFFLLLEDMHEGFADRARQVRALLRAEQTTFIVVTTPETVPVREAESFADALSERSLHVGLMIANRVLPETLLNPSALRAAETMTRRADELAGELVVALEAAAPHPERRDELERQLQLVLAEVGRNYANFNLVAARQGELLSQLAASRVDVVTVPQLAREVIDLAALVEIGERLYRGRGAAQSELGPPTMTAVLDYHVHLWPHPERAEPAELRLERLAEYCAAADAAGVAEIALTEHLFRFVQVRKIADSFWNADANQALAAQMGAYFEHHATADLDVYVEAVLDAKRAGLPVVLGLEVDYYKDKMSEVAQLLAQYPFDVILGSVHWLGAWGFDNLEEVVSRQQWTERATEVVWRDYTAAIEELAGSGAVDVLAHPDLVKVAGKRPGRAAIEECEARIAEAARDSGLAAEISSAGLTKPVREIYPTPSLLDRFFAAGVAVTTASDTHGPSRLGADGRALADLARGAGYGSLRAFRARRGRDVPIGAFEHAEDAAVAPLAVAPSARERGPMSASDEVARQLTALDTAARQHLARLVAGWGLLADLSFSDLLLFVPSDEYSLADARRGIAAHSNSSAAATRGLRFVVLGQMRPTTNQTLFQSDQVGDVVPVGDVPLVAEAWQRGTITTGEWSGTDLSGLTRMSCIPVRFKGEVVGVLSRVWSPTAGRQRGRLERAYLRIFENLARMVAAGIYPFHAEEEAEDPPRVGDGVIVLDAEQRVQFASPNAVNAFHRMGVAAPTNSATLLELGFGAEIVASSFSLRMPVVEEIERRPDVTVLMNCIPLIEDGRVVGAAVLLRDVTDLRRRDRLLLSKDAALREVHHRVKNNLQTISSLLRLQSRRLEDPAARDALLEAEHRIRAIAAVHEVLASTPGDQVLFEETVPTLLALARDANVSSNPVDVEVVGEVGVIDGDLATPLALVIAELLHNAVEHAFTVVVDQPAVVLRFGGDRTHLIVEVADNGVGFPPGFDIDRTRSLGLAIVRDLVRSQLGGSITINNEHGAVVRLDVPLLRGEGSEASPP